MIQYSYSFLVIAAIVEIVLFSVMGLFLARSVRREALRKKEAERLARELSEAYAEINDVSRFNAQLLSLASHQVKSPLSAMSGLTTMLLDELYGPIDAEVREALGKMRESSDALLDLIETLLDVRKIEEGRMDYQFARTDIAALVQATMEEFEPLASQKGLNVSFATSSPSLWVSADQEKLRRVVQHIISNALRYTPQGFVSVALRDEKDAVVFSVSDSGLGIPPSIIDQIFERFVRDERMKREVVGSGLGLYVAKKIVEAHGGRIWAESSGVNQGSRFHVALRNAA